MEKNADVSLEEWKIVNFSGSGLDKMRIDQMTLRTSCTQDVSFKVKITARDMDINCYT